MNKPQTMHKPKVEILHKVRPKLEALELQRVETLKARRKTEWTALLLVIVGIALVVLLGTYSGENLVSALIFGTFTCIGIAVYYLRTARLKAKDDLQQSIGSVITEAMGDNWRYAADRHLRPGLVKRSGLVAKSRTIYGNNLIRGAHGNTQFSFSNINISSEGKDGRSDIFGGILLAIDFNKEIKGKTLIFPDLAQNALGSWLGKKVQSFGWDGLELVYLEDPIFEKAFAVYGSDQVEARYILTPHMMSNMINLKEKYGNRLSFSFMQGTVFVAIDSVRPFESDLNAPILPDGTFYHFYKSIDLVTDVIDTLQLNTRIWSK